MPHSVTANPVTHQPAGPSSDQVVADAVGLLGWYGEPWVIERLHRHGDIELNLVAGGELHYLMGGSRLVIRAGEVAAYWAVTPHRIIHCEPDSRLGVLHIPLTEFLRWELPHGIRTNLLQGAQRRRSQNAEFDHLLFQRWAADLQRSSVPAPTQDSLRHHRAVMLEAEAFIHRFLTLEDAPEAGETLDDARRSQAERLAHLIAERHTEPLSAEVLARALGLNPNYAMTLFKRAFGLTMREFLTQHRVAHAQRLLVTGNLSLLDVPSILAFRASRGFTRCSRRIRGCHRSHTGNATGIEFKPTNYVHLEPQCAIASMIAPSARPFSVSVYSTLGGISGNCTRSSAP